jgi:ribosomal protein L7/L12
MALPNTPLPPDVLEALGRGRTIDAIKRLRKATGMGLAEAKSAIEMHVRANPRASGQSRHGADGTNAPDLGRVLPDAVREALQRGDKMAAIRLLHERTGLGLKAAAERVAAATGADFTALDHRADHRIEAPPPQQVYLKPGLAPGEVPRSNASLWFVLLLAALAIAGYFFLM